MSLTSCVYTALIGQYENLNEQEIAKRSSIPFICLTDDPDLRSDSWTIRLVEPTFAMDPIRSQRDLKLRPHIHLPDFDRSLYIDNSVVLTADPEHLLDSFLSASPFAMPTHSFRETLLDEFLEVARLGFDDLSRIFEQLNHYALADPSILDEKPYWGGVIFRNHREAAVKKVLEIWIAQVFRYSRRDQLSANMAFRQAKLAPAKIEIDNHHSWFHTWPHAVGRQPSKGVRSVITSLSPAVARVRQLESYIRTLEEQLRNRDEQMRKSIRLPNWLTLFA
jgi:hypothetical protein